jgi:hypothetical protein
MLQVSAPEAVGMSYGRRIGCAVVEADDGHIGRVDGGSPCQPAVHENKRYVWVSGLSLRWRLTQKIEKSQADAAQILAQILLRRERFLGDGFLVKVYSKNVRAESSSNSHDYLLILSIVSLLQLWGSLAYMETLVTWIARPGLCSL